MIVIVYDNPSDEVRGKTRRYLYEVKPNVFIGNVSAKVRDTFWKEINATGVSALLMHDAKNEQGFVVKATDSAMDAKFAECLGLYFPTKNKTKLLITDILAKPEKTLLQHSIEAGVMAEAIMREGPAKLAIRNVAKNTGNDVEKLIMSACFIIAAHDIGKCHSDFQAKMAEKNEHLHSILSAINLLNPTEKDIFRHESDSMWALIAHAEQKGWSAKQVRKFRRFACIAAYHHQGKVHNWAQRPTCNDSATWYALQNDLLNELEKHWQFAPELLDTEDGICGLTYVILAILTNADWMVSSAKWENTLRGVPATLQQKAYAFLKENRLLHDEMANHIPNIDFQTIFGYLPNELQKAVIALASNGFQMMIIEGPCGVGKTAAGLIAAIIAGVSLSGIYLAMPTKATVRGIIESVRKAFANAGIEEGIPEFDSSAILSDDDRDRIDPELFSCAARLHMLYHWGVGTVDQSLKTIGVYKYACLGLLGLMDKAYIVDEVHAYDAFMLYQLERQIQECRFMGVPVILQTATLPTKTKERLIRAAGVQNPKCETGYPLITVCNQGTMTQVKTTAQGKQYIVRTKLAKDVFKAMEKTALSITQGCALFIVDTPSNAITLYKKLRQQVPEEELFLYHSRDTVDAKTAKADKLVKLFGKDRSSRPERAIVIATSIVEQSLDIDMDYLFTLPCPIDLLLQRMGRECRHVWPVNTPEVVVFVPEDLSSIRIYKTQLLELTLDVLGESCTIDTIQDVRNLIDSVYFAYDSKNEDEMKRMRSSGCILDNPMLDTPNNTDTQGIAYERMNQQDAVTRFAEYPTIQIAIIPPELLNHLDFETERKILKQYTVSVPEYKLKCFACYAQTEQGLLTDVRLYLSDTGEISECGHTVALTKLGLEFL